MKYGICISCLWITPAMIRDQHFPSQSMLQAFNIHFQVEITRKVRCLHVRIPTFSPNSSNSSSHRRPPLITLYYINSVSIHSSQISILRRNWYTISSNIAIRKLPRLASLDISSLITGNEGFMIMIAVSDVVILRASLDL